MKYKHTIDDLRLIGIGFIPALIALYIIYYLAYCWSKEIGIVLRADMIWCCVLYEFSKHITETKDKYFNDFNNVIL